MSAGSKDFLAGLLFLAFGAAGGLAASRYRFGSMAEMGPGYLPAVVSGVVALLGIVLVVRALGRRDHPETALVWEWRSLAFVTAAILAFMLLIESRGLIAAVAALILISCAARQGMRLVETLVLLIVLAGLAILIFVYGLELPIKVVVI